MLFTLAAVSSLQILNLIRRWGVWGPLRKGVPSDGLQALWLIRRRRFRRRPRPQRNTGSEILSVGRRPS